MIYASSSLVNPSYQIKSKELQRWFFAFFTPNLGFRYEEMRIGFLGIVEGRHKTTLRSWTNRCPVTNYTHSDIFIRICDATREDPPSRLAKMGAMPTPFRGLDRALEDTPPVQTEREEPSSDTPPGKHVSP